ncbi:MAG: family 1 extracellular solute-binding protein [Paenibacillus sp.]|jgi:multiple sugar transport system substrate-binding protein|nr:family 1 extracellular solute-binding protein [Paenibacillus sp.]
MKALYPKSGAIAAIIAVTVTAAGCGGGEGAAKGTTKEGASQQAQAQAVDMNKPVTLRFWANPGKAIFDQEVGNRIKQKYPNVTVELMDPGKKSLQDSLTELITAGTVPDLIWLPNAASVQTIKKLGIEYDLNELIKKHKFDLLRFDAALLENVKNQGAKGEMYALPWQSGPAAMFYNKDIFYKFGVPYPKDGMTWSETLELGKTLTRMDGIQYRGFDPGLYNHFQEEYGISAYDAKTNQASFTTNPKWKTILEFLQQSYQLPGNYPADKAIGADRSGFMKDKNVAMLPWAAYFQPFLDARKEGLNFNIVSLPTWPDAKGQGSASVGASLALTGTSKLKEEAFEILKFLTSDEVETANSRIGFAPAINAPSAKEQFGKELAGMEDIRVSSVFYNKITPLPIVDPLLETVSQRPFFGVAIQAVGKGQKDVNTALREAQEAANKAIQEEQKK